MSTKSPDNQGPTVLEYVKGENPDRPMTGAEKFLLRTLAHVALPAVTFGVVAVAEKFLTGTTTVAPAVAAVLQELAGFLIVNQANAVSAKRESGYGNWEYRNQQ